MEKYKIDNNEYLIKYEDDIESILYTDELGEDVAILCFDKMQRIAALGRSLDDEKLNDLFEAFNIDSIREPISVSIIGGNNSEKSTNYLNDLICNLLKIDNDRDVINIVSYDTNERVHPESVGLNSFSGLIYSDIS